MLHDVCLQDQLERLGGPFHGLETVCIESIGFVKNYSSFDPFLPWNLKNHLKDKLFHLHLYHVLIFAAQRKVLYQFYVIQMCQVQECLVECLNPFLSFFYYNFLCILLFKYTTVGYQFNLQYSDHPSIMFSVSEKVMKVMKAKYGKRTYTCILNTDFFTSKICC